MVPGNASGGMDGVALKPLTVDFHEPGFVSRIAGENNQPFWFQMSGEQRQKAGSPWGPANPQALNRYSYVQNNPLKYEDPSGHVTYDRERAQEVRRFLADVRDELKDIRKGEIVTLAGGVLASLLATGAAWGLGWISASAAGASGIGTSILSILAGLADPNHTQALIDYCDWMIEQLDMFDRYAAQHPGATITFWVDSPEKCGTPQCEAARTYQVHSYWGGRESRPYDIPRSFAEKLQISLGTHR